METQQKAFREAAPKEENYKKQGKGQSSEWLAQHGLRYPGEKRRGISGTPEP